MSLLEQQNFTARLFMDENLRRDFAENPEITAQKHNLDEKDVLQLKELLSGELDSFADSLFYKRLHEVEKLLPLTKKYLSKEFQSYFREFANDFQPKTIKKHLEDAVNFAEFLSKKSLAEFWLTDVIIFEQSRLKFNGYHKSFILKRFSSDPREFAGGNPRKRKTFVVWLRIGKYVKQLIF